MIEKLRRLLFDLISNYWIRSVPNIKINSKDIVLGIRPEDIEIGISKNSFSGIVEIEENIGSAYIIYCKVGDVRIVIVSTIKGDLRKGDKIDIRFNNMRKYIL